jgi:hypothetical protein
MFPSFKCTSITTLFRIDDTFEMKTIEYGEICISIDKLEVVARVFISNGKKGEESKIAERQRESVCVCVCASVGQNPQQCRSTSTAASGRENTSVAINDCWHL